MDFTDFNFLNANQLDNKYEIPDSFTRNPINSNEPSTSSFAKPPNNTNDQYINELDKVLEILYNSVYSDESSIPSSTSPSSTHSTENNKLERSVSTTSNSTDSDATIDPNATPIAPYLRRNKSNRNPNGNGTNEHIRENRVGKSINPNPYGTDENSVKKRIHETDDDALNKEQFVITQGIEQKKNNHLRKPNRNKLLLT